MARKTKTPSDRPTLVDVAREAGVSAITVSRTIRSPGIVSDKARRKVEEAIRRLGYTPDPAASALACMRAGISSQKISSRRSAMGCPAVGK